MFYSPAGFVRLLSTSLCLGLISPLLNPVFSGLPVAHAQTSTQAQTLQKKRVVVMPFHNLSQNPADDWMGLSFAENLTQRLGALHELTVLERTQIQQLLKEQNFGQSLFSAPEQAPALGQMLGAQLMLIGTYQLQGEKLLVQARFVEVETGQVDRVLRYEVQGQKKDLYALQSQLATYFAEQFARNRSEAEKNALQQAEALTQNPEAQGAFLTAQEELVNNPQQAIRLLEKALSLDPDYVLPYAELAKIWSSEHIFSEKYGKGWVFPAKPLAAQELLQRAQTALAQAKRLNPEHLQTQSAAIYTSYAAGNKPQALDLIKKIPVEPNTAAAVFELFTFIYFDFEGPQSVGAYREIEAWANTLLQQQPAEAAQREITLSLIEMSNGLDLSATELQTLEKRVQHLQQSSPQDLGLVMTLLDLQKRQGKTDAAEHSFQRAMALSQHNGLAKMTLANLAADNEDYATQLRLSEEAIALGFQHPSIYLSLSAAHLQLGHREKAQAILHQQIQTIPHHTDALSLLSNIETSPWLVEQLKKSLHHAEQQHIYPSPSGTPLNLRLILARQYKGLNQWEKAQSTLMEALNQPGTSNSERAQVYELLSHLYFTSPYESSSPQRVDALKKALSLSADASTKVRLHQSLADEYQIYQNKPEQARAELETALLLADAQEAVEIKLALARLWESQEDHAQAQRLLDELLALPQHPAKSYYVQSTVWAAQGNYTKAAEFMATFLQKDTWAAQQPFYQNLYKSYLLETRLQAEIRDHGKAQHQTLNDLAVTYMGMQDWESAIHLLQSLIKKDPQNATFHYNLGSAYLGQHQWTEAMAALRQAVQHQKNYPAAWFNLAFAQLQAGQPDEARQSVIQLKLLQPDYPGLDALTQQLLSKGNPS